MMKIILKKNREYEFEIEDLKGKLEETMEDLITTQTEFEEYKNKSKEEIQRYKEKLEDEKNNNDVLEKIKLLLSNEKKKENQLNKNQFNPFDDDISSFKINRANTVCIKNNFDSIIKNKRNIKKENIKFKLNIKKKYPIILKIKN